MAPAARPEHNLPGWRKAAIWRTQLKTLLRVCGTIHHAGGAKKPERLEAAVTAYLQKAYALEQKVFASLGELWAQPLSPGGAAYLAEVEGFHEKLIKHLDLIERRVLKGKTIPHAEKDFSLFEPHAEWISKGKVSAPVELEHKVLITTDQYSLVLDYKVMEQSSDVKETLPLADRLLARFGDGSLQRGSVDKGFSAQQDRELLELFIPGVIMPKMGRWSQAEQDRETQKTFRRLRRQDSAIESDIKALEHHGLNRCPDKGWSGFQRYVGLGILAYNLHKIGHRLLAHDRRHANRHSSTPPNAAHCRKKCCNRGRPPSRIDGEVMDEGSHPEQGTNGGRGKMLGSRRSGAEERFWSKISEPGENGVFSQTLFT